MNRCAYSSSFLQAVTYKTRWQEWASGEFYDAGLQAGEMGMRPLRICLCMHVFFFFCFSAFYYYVPFRRRRSPGKVVKKLWSRMRLRPDNFDGPSV